MVRGVLVNGRLVVAAEMPIGEEPVPASALLGMPLRARQLDALSESEPYLISSFMGSPRSGMSATAWIFGGLLGRAPQTFVARADDVPFLPEHFHRCLESLAAAVGGDDGDEDGELVDANGTAETTDPPVTLGDHAVHLFRELLRDDLLPPRGTTFAQIIGMDSEDDAVNSFVFGVWGAALKRDHRGWADLAALKSPAEVPPLFERVFAGTSYVPEKRRELKSAVRFRGLECAEERRPTTSAGVEA